MLGPFLTLQVEGTINETFTVDLLVESAAGKVVFIDVGKLARITSFGSRQWIRAITALSQKAQQVFIENCSFAFVSQLNMIRGFAGTATVLSVTAPVFCNTCDRDMKVPVDIRQGVPENVKAKCAQCGGDAEMAEDMETYFAFASLHGLNQSQVEHVALVRQYDNLRASQSAPIDEGVTAPVHVLSVPPPSPSTAPAAAAPAPAAPASSWPAIEGAGKPAASPAGWSAPEGAAKAASMAAAPAMLAADSRRWVVTNDVLLALLVGFLAGAFIATHLVLAQPF
ncbi:MAG: hypothetical protein HY903_07665 [Deltaproteobacteria bacterium]|nr:hypothetical protein [Deltaproteobacteria bacterium]